MDCGDVWAQEGGVVCVIYMFTGGYQLGEYFGNLLISHCVN